MAKGTAQPTKERLLAAASRLFAERGFQATSVREIAERAGTNVASGNYHYGSKKALYLEVLREQFRNIQNELQRRGASRPRTELSTLSREELIQVFRSRVEAMLELTLGPPPSLHATLMHREMCDPSEALPVIAAEFMTPMTAEMGQIISRLFPELHGKDVERCVYSVAGQAMFYRFAMPALLHIQGRTKYPSGFAREIAEHIAEFSLAGAKQISERSKRKRRAR
jgi:AcrR family transcriptional regulator